MPRAATPALKKYGIWLIDSSGETRQDADDAQAAGDLFTAVVEANEHLVEQAVEAVVAFVKFGVDARLYLAEGLLLEVGVLVAVEPGADFVVADVAVVVGPLIVFVREFDDGEGGAVDRHVEAVVVDVADRGVAVVESAHRVGAFGGSDLEHAAPGGIRVRAHAGRVEEDADGVAAEAVLYEDVVVLRDEEVVAGGDAADQEFDIVIADGLFVGDVDDLERGPAPDLLGAEGVADVFVGEAAAGALGHGEQEVAAADEVQTFEESCRRASPTDAKISVFDWYTHLGVCPECHQAETLPKEMSA